ncbi:hypothetical protein [Streptacidiphilus sp. EB129]|uniref:hypothetical protein n=1 Tax=Streptacidiphilus sp. EB129 TaxID=3156262 RepID=UPI0035173EF4
MVDADELLVRIRRVRDWAGGQAERYGAERGRLEAAASDVPDAQQDQHAIARTNAAIRAETFAVVHDTLDEILNPGRHSE